MADDTEREFWVLAVKLLFRRMDEGQIELVRDLVPETVRALEAVRFDENGDPLYESISGPVRALANLVYTHEVERLEKEAEERERSSPVHELLTERVEISDAILQGCTTGADFSHLAFELYKEAGAVIAVAAHSYVADAPGHAVFERDQAICAGLLVRIAKFMISVVQLVGTSPSGDRAEVVMVLNRCITESAINLKFLVVKNEARYFDEFVKSSLGPERELHDLIQENIRERGGERWPMENRMLRSIERTLKVSGVRIQDVPRRSPDWGGNLRERLKALELDKGYVVFQRIPSHAVHGTWVDLLLHHLEEKDGRFAPDPSWTVVDPRQLCPIAVIVLDAVRTYLDKSFRDFPELTPLHRRIGDLEERLFKVDRAHEGWLQSRRSSDRSSAAQDSSGDDAA